MAVLFKRFGKRRRGGGQIGVFLAPEGVALARQRSGGEEPVLDIAVHRDCAGPAEWGAVLSQLAREHRLSGAPAVCVLHPGAYQLTQIEAPDVPPEELRGAVRWRLKEFLTYRVEDAVVDAFPLPQAGGRAGPAMMLAVAAPLRGVRAVAEAVEAAGLKVQAIDIPELALRNLAAQVPDQGGGIAVVSLTDDAGLITISQGDQLYLARALEFGARQLAGNPDGWGDALVLELQRSLDYYESQLASRPASRVLLAPMSGDRDALLARLREQLGASSFALDLGQVLELPEEVDPLVQARALFAVGGALRAEESA